MPEATDGAGQPKNQLCVVCGQRAEGRNVRHFNPESFPVGFVTKEGDSVHAACRQAVQRAAEAGARLAAGQAAVRAAAASYPLRGLLQEVQRTREALPAHRQPRQGGAAQLGPVLPPGVPLPAATPCDEGMGVEEEQREEYVRRGGDEDNCVQAPPGVAAGKAPTNPSSCHAVILLGWPDLQQHYKMLAANCGSVQHKSKGKKQQLEQAQAQLAPCPCSCPL